MRLTKLVLLGALLALASLGSASAQTSQWTTTHEVAACATDADQPVCFLRVLSHFPTHSPYSTNWRLIGAQEVLAALGEAGTGADGGQYAHIPYESTRAIYGHLDATNAAVAQAILADRNGASPRAALRHVLGDIDLERLVPGPNTGARCMRLADIWRAYGTPQERERRPDLPRPSLALARTALETCDRLNAPADSVSPQEMAERYAALGEVEAARRLMARDTRPAAIVEAETAVIVSDWERVTVLFSAPGRNFDERTRLRFEYLRSEVFTKLKNAGRVDLASALGRAAIENFITDEADTNNNLGGDTLELLVANGGRAEAQRLTERLDAMGRDTTQARSLAAANAALRGWVALGETPRARALADLWAPRVQWQYDSESGGCGGRERPFCASFSVMDMYSRVGAVEEGWRVAHEGPAWIYLSNDFGAGRGIQNLDVHFAHIASERGRDDFLGQCADRGNWTPQQLEWSALCARRLLDRAAANAGPPNTDRLRQLRVAATAAIKVSENAARQGNGALLDEMLPRALTAYAQSQNAGLTPSERTSLQEIAIYQLERARRL